MKLLQSKITRTQTGFSINFGGKLSATLDLVQGPGTNELKQSYWLKA
jgi:hypothetical protein